MKFLLHRWKDLQDENGDMTKESIRDALLYDFCKSFMGNWIRRQRGDERGER